MSNTFANLGLSDRLVQVLTGLDVTSPFPVQAAAIPPGLAGKDIQGNAPTGSGKTLAFGLPLLTLVDKASRNRPTALVLAPTRELAEQIKRDLEPLARAADRRVCAVYGGVGYGPQLKALRDGADVLVATPGRLEDLIERRSVDLGQASFVVVDEADRMADMGFMPAVRRILDQTSHKRQTLLFSATLDGEIAVLSRDYQHNPVRIDAEAKDSQEIDVIHHFWRVARSERPAQTAQLVNAAGRSIVFTRTRHGADRLVRQLSKENVSAVTMHGGRSQSQRTRALKAFSTGKAQALVATDVAARGIHVEDVAAVVHFDMAADHKDYVHRSGRTGRAGATGVVITLVADGQDPDVRKLLRDLKLKAAIEAPHLDRLTTAGHRMGHARGAVAGGAVGRVDRNDRGRPRSHGPNKTEGRSIFVGNLPWKTTSGDLEEMFSEYGTVVRASISTQAKSGRSKGFGFVDIVEHRADAAIEALNGAMVGGRPLRIRPAR
jgi:superfamily II DNA/RNA helicase